MTFMILYDMYINDMVKHHTDVASICMIHEYLHHVGERNPGLAILKTINTLPSPKILLLTSSHHISRLCQVSFGLGRADSRDQCARRLG